MQEKEHPRHKVEKIIIYRIFNELEFEFNKLRSIRLRIEFNEKHR